MANYTNNYQLEEPTYAEIADVAVFNRNMTKIDDIMHASQVSLAPAYDSTQTYNEGDVVMYELLMYECTDDNVTGTWDGSKWQRTTAGEHGGGGTEVEANPSGTATAGDLTKLRVGQDIYSIPSGGGGGTTVVPNPQGTPTQTLNTIGINNVIYDIAGSGGGAEGDGYQSTLLWDYVDDNSGTIPYGTYTETLRDYIDNYNVIILEFASAMGDLNNVNWDSTVFVTLDVEALNNAWNPNKTNVTTFGERSSRFYIHDNVLQKTTDNQGDTNGLIRVYGVKFGGGSGNTETYSETKLYEYTDTALPSTITLSHDWSDFDAIVFDVTRSGDTRQNMMLLTSNLSIGSDIVWTGYDGEYFIYDLTSGTTLTKGNTGGSDIKITNIKGINFGGALLSEDIAEGQWTQLISQAGGAWSSATAIPADTTHIAVLLEYQNAVYMPFVFSVDEYNKIASVTGNDVISYGLSWKVGSDYDEIAYRFDSANETISVYAGYNGITIKAYAIKAKKNVVGALDYSTTEQDTGKKWIDGKPIYQKVLTVTNASARPSDWVNIETDNTIDFVVKIEATHYNYSTQTFYHSPYATASYDATTGYIRYYVSEMPAGSYGDTYVIIEYTKATA